MKDKKGITLVSLVIYIVVMVIILGGMNSIINSFYSNINEVQGNVQEVVELNNFNTYFLKEVKSYNNKVDTVTENYILFSSGNSFLINNNVIYYNNIPICKGVQSFEITLVKDNEDEDEEYSIINVALKFSSITKSLNYKLENIY